MTANPSSGLLDDLLGTAGEHSEHLVRMSVYPDWKKVIRAKEDIENDKQILGDIESERLLIRRLNRLMPGIPVCTEENLAANSSRNRDYSVWANPNDLFFLVDPIDGSAHFMLENGLSGDWGFTICLMEKCEPVISLVCLPAYGEIYYTARNTFSFSLIRGVAREFAFREADPAKIPVAYSESTGKRHLRAKMAPINEHIARAADLRNTGCTVANFRQMFIGMSDIVGSAGHPWDWMAASHIVRNAGGAASEFSGKPLSMSTTLGCLAATGERTLAFVREFFDRKTSNRILCAPSINWEEFGSRLVLERGKSSFADLIDALSMAKEAWPVYTEFYAIGDFSEQEAEKLFLTEGVITAASREELPNRAENFRRN